MQQKLLNIEEVSEMTRLTPATLRWLRAQGRGPKSGKLGRRIMYREHEVEAWIEQQFEQAPGA